jgi:hypothetical protein
MYKLHKKKNNGKAIDYLLKKTIYTFKKRGEKRGSKKGEKRGGGEKGRKVRFFSIPICT